MGITESYVRVGFQRPGGWLFCPLQLLGEAPSLDGVLSTHRLGCFYGHKSVIPFLPTNVAKGPVICDVLCDVGNFVNSMMMLKGLWETNGRAYFRGPSLRAVNQQEMRFSYVRTGPKGFGKAAWSRWKEKELCLPLRDGGSPPRSRCCDRRDKQGCSYAAWASGAVAPSSCRSQWVPLSSGGSCDRDLHDAALSQCWQDTEHTQVPGPGGRCTGYGHRGRHSQPLHGYNFRTGGDWVSWGPNPFL